MKTEDITLCLFNFNNFKRINEKYGRDYADEFVAYMSKKLTKNFGDQVEIFSTEIDEFCIVFNKDMPKSRTDGIAQKALSMLSQPVQVQEAQIQLTVAGCLCNCAINAYHSASKLFIALDYNIQQAKQQCAKNNTSVIIHLQ